jgi:hypothetical protein
MGVCVDDVASGGACNPATSPSVCAYTSNGETTKNNCQINTCCVDCVSDEEAVLKNFGTVCVNSNTASEIADTETFIRIEAETPVSVEFFNANGHTYKEALAEAFVGMGTVLSKDAISFAWVNPGLCPTMRTALK